MEEVGDVRRVVSVGRGKDDGWDVGKRWRSRRGVGERERLIYSKTLLENCIS